ncbi:MAG: winged helix DNA-binding domain-containing protein [Actinomycetota bacterium]
MHRITTAERRRRLAERHRLIPAGRTDDPVVITDDLVTLHSSDPATVHLSCLVRMVDPSIVTVERALYDDRSLVRHHAMRRTIWVMTRRTARLAHAAATLKIAKGERKKNIQAVEKAGQADDPEAWWDAASAEIAAHLAEVGSRSARAIGLELPHLAVPLEYGTAKHYATLNAHSKILQGGGFDALFTRGAPTGIWTSSEYLWNATEAFLGEPIAGLDTRTAAAELVEHYLRRFGPATETDLRWWFGETATLVRNALADIGAVEVALDGDTTGWVVAGDVDDATEPEPWLRLLPGLDATPMGWKERDWYLDPGHVNRLFDRFGNVGPTIWADGQIVGGWVQRPDGTIVHELLAAISDDHHDLLTEGVADLERVLDGVQVKPRFPSKNQKELLAG